MASINSGSGGRAGGQQLRAGTLAKQRAEAALREANVRKTSFTLI